MSGPMGWMMVLWVVVGIALLGLAGYGVYALATRRGRGGGPPVGSPPA